MHVSQKISLCVLLALIPLLTGCGGGSNGNMTGGHPETDIGSSTGTVGPTTTTGTTSTGTTTGTTTGTATGTAGKGITLIRHPSSQGGVEAMTTPETWTNRAGQFSKAPGGFLERA
ncbi:MAG: hypothetical protein ACRYFS_20785 [Janthinobacterium lividum]